MATIKHHDQTAEPNDPTKDVSADAWNAAHDVTLVDGDIPASIARDTEVTAAVAAEALLARNADNLASGTVADARIAATIARDSEVTSAVAAEATARDAAIETHRADTTVVHGITDTSALALTGHSHAGEDITSGVVADVRVAATMARDSEVTSAVAAEAVLARNADNLTSGTVADARIASTIARDSEVTAAVGAHEAAGDPHPGYLTTAEGNAAYDVAGAAASAQAASQPLDSDLTAIAALSTTAYGRSLLAAANAAALRTLAGTVIGTDVDAFGAAAAAQAASQPLDSDLTAIAALTTTSYGRAFLALADAAAGRTALGLGTLATQSGTFSGTSSGTNTGDQSLPTRASLGLDTTDSPQFAGLNIGAATDTTITRTGAGDVAVEGNALYRAGGTDVPLTDGGTGASTASAARTNLGVVPGTDVASLTAGVVPIAQLATGTPTGAKFIRDDGTLQVPAGGGLAQSFAGYNTIGGTFTPMVVRRHYVKKITVATAFDLLSIDAHIRANTDNTVNFVAFFLDDNAGAPGKLLSWSGTLDAAGNVYLSTSATVPGAGSPGRWFSSAVSGHYAAGDYWIGVVAGATYATRIDLANDGSGTDVYYTRERRVRRRRLFRRLSPDDGLGQEQRSSVDPHMTRLETTWP